MRSDDTIPEGMCQCGCGKPAPVWTRNRPSEGIYKGMPKRFINGHAWRGRSHPAMTEKWQSLRESRTPVNPSGLCMCGCGGKTTISPNTVERLGYVKGEPRRYLPGHHNRKSVAEYVVDAETGCWIWQRARDGKGYGLTKCGGRKNCRAHRISYERHRGPIPEGMDLDHLCRNPPCVNPDHLEPVTHAENIRRGYARKRAS